MTEVETPWAMENDSHVEKAEACTKELEDVSAYSFYMAMFCLIRS